MKIGELAARTDCAVETIRYYEREGLLPAPRRSAGARRTSASAISCAAEPAPRRILVTGRQGRASLGACVRRHSASGPGAPGRQRPGGGARGLVMGFKRQDDVELAARIVQPGQGGDQSRQAHLHKQLKRN